MASTPIRKLNLKDCVSRVLLYRQAMHIYLAFTGDWEVVICLFRTLMSRSILYSNYCEISTFARYVVHELLFTNARFRAKAATVRLWR
jgi:hypothetical protein